MPNFDVSTKDIKDYLQTLEPDEVCGTCGKPGYCLVANALTHKYKGVPFYVRLEAAETLAGFECTFSLPKGVQEVVRIFDCIGSYGQPIPREKAEQELKEII